MSGRGGRSSGGRSSGGRGGRSSSRGGGGRSSGGRGGGRGGRGDNVMKGYHNPCQAYTTGGNCPRGDSCNFGHVVRLFKAFPASTPMPQQNTGGYNGYNSNANNPRHYAVKSIAIWESNGIQIFTGSEDGYWRLWNTAGMSFNKTFEQNMNGPVASLKVVSNHLFCGFSGTVKGAPDAKAGQVHVWNLAQTGNPPMELHIAEPWLSYAHSQNVTCLEIVDNAGSPRIISGSADGAIRVWTHQNNKFAMEKSLPGHAGAVTGLCMIPGGNLLWSSSMDGTLRIWDLAQPDVTACQHCISRETVPHTNNPQGGAPLGGHSGGVTALLPFSMNAGNFLISGSMDGTVKVWDAATGNCVQAVDSGEGVVSMSVATTQTNIQVLLIGLQSGNIHCRNIMPSPNGTPAFTLLFNLSGKYTAAHSGSVNAVVGGPAATFYTGGKDGQVMVWQLTGDLSLT